MNAGGGWLVALSILVALIAAIVHLPESWPQWLGWLRPAWVPIVLFYWVIEVPHRIGLISAWLIGLVLDVLQAEPLGLNALLLASITYIGCRLHERLRMYAVLQHSMLLFAMLLVTEFCRRVVHQLSTGSPIGVQFLFVPLTSAIVWPFVYLFMTNLRTRVRGE